MVIWILPDVVYTDVTTIVVRKVVVLGAVVVCAGCAAVRDTMLLEEAGNKGRDAADADGHISVMTENSDVVVGGGGIDEGDTKVDVTDEDCTDVEMDVEDPMVETDDADSDAETSVEETMVETDDADSEVESEEEDDTSEVEADEDDAERGKADVSEVDELEGRENQMTATATCLTMQMQNAQHGYDRSQQCERTVMRHGSRRARVSQDRDERRTGNRTLD